ncbi:MAG: GatB/YqeY domain-containing protein [Chloroherpetonaceae bacterium]|nr:GatB/YqeY domain-containing protein [Chloroherpetonaceae bacterium]
MNLKERVTEDLKNAMKQGDKVKVETLRFIKKELLEKETVQKRTVQGELTPEEEIEALVAMVKRRKDSIEQFKNSGRADLAESELKELVIVESYLPTQMTEDEVKTYLLDVIAKMGVTSQKEAGKVMGFAMKELKGKTEGTIVQKILKELLPAV